MTRSEGRSDGNWAGGFLPRPEWPLPPSAGFGWSGVGLAADEDPELGFLGVVSLRDVAQVCEEHQVRQARGAGWT